MDLKCYVGTMFYLLSFWQHLALVVVSFALVQVYVQGTYYCQMIHGLDRLTTPLEATFEERQAKIPVVALHGEW